MPVEAVDDAHHRIEAVPKPPLLGDDDAKKSTGDTQGSSCTGKGDEIAKVTVFRVQGGDSKRRAQACKQCEENKGLQEYDLPAWPGSVKAISTARSAKMNRKSTSATIAEAVRITVQ